MSEDPIYAFPILRQYLEENDIPIGHEYTAGYRQVKVGDINIDSKGNLVGDVHLDEVGMFSVVDSGNVERKVFLIKKSFYFEWNGRSSIPKAHLCLCSAIQEHGEESYKYANSQPVEVFDRGSRKLREVNNLEVCGYCSKILRGEYAKAKTIDDFIEILKKTNEGMYDQEEDQDVNYSGYVRKWEEISQAYRELKKYTCEKCGIVMDDFEGRIYCHVHHKDGNKLHNNTKNFQCLCIECHSQIDDNHRKNFSTKAQQVMIKRFRDYKLSQTQHLL